jgi:hypothetical protein
MRVLAPGKAAAKPNIRAIIVLFSVFLTTIGRNWASIGKLIYAFSGFSPTQNKNDSVNNKTKIVSNASGKRKE